MPETILTITNNHVDACGHPSHLTNSDRNLYRGYFQNSDGDQFLFTYDRKTKKATLRGGDWGWEEEIPVKSGMAFGKILRREEQAWLQACWAEATEYDRLPAWLPVERN